MAPATDVCPFDEPDSTISMKDIKPQSNGVNTVSKQQPLLPVVQEFKAYIEADRRLFLYFNQMWEQSNAHQCFPGHTIVKDYDHMFALLNDILQSTPKWTLELYHAGSAGIPIGDMFYYAVATPAGYAAFTDPGVSRMIKKMLVSWGQYLSSLESAQGLESWMSKHGARDLLCAVANGARETNLKFEELFECDPEKPNYGYKSWDEFFVRRFRAGIRPIASPEDEDTIGNACESKCYNIAHNVQYHDRFWIKGNVYSLWDMLQQEDLAQGFVGGTVYQAFLSQYSYHRWHAPVSGVVRHAYTLEGMYYAIPEFDEKDSRAFREDEKIDAEEWQAWLACQGTRGVIVIEADNAALGLVGFVAVGMMEVSTVEIGVRVGQRVKRGDEIGMFHYGGSSHCLLFQKGVDVWDFPSRSPEREHNFPVNGAVARLRASRTVQRT